LREKLYEALLALKIPEKLVRLIKATMKDTTAQVRIQTELTDAFQMKK
jgi:Trm5-related predicted tRNA methylase